ncbi:MAG: hypothetical protein P1U67_11905 [Alcanivoracaceae bacterium]|nr:hypothetical protein [Alcanivoracaceae bacterium]
MTLKSLSVLGLALIFSGCQMLSYQEPEGDNNATVVFSSDDYAVQPAICVPGKGFESTLISVAKKRAESQFANDMNTVLKKSETVEVKVSTERKRAKVGFIMQRKHNNGPRERCKVAAEFMISAGQQYHATFTKSGEHCGIAITDANNEPATDTVIVPWGCQ